MKQMYSKHSHYYLKLLKSLFIFILIQSSLLTSVYASNDSIYFPASEFWMGSKDNEGRLDEKPIHKVFLDEFYLDKFETTGKDFEEFLLSFPKEKPPITGWFGRKVRPGLEKSPVIGLSWKRCQKYCRWRGKRLPTEAEWERAATGLNQRYYPWGNQPPTSKRANFNNCCFIMKGNILKPVGTYKLGKTPEGIFEMAGNIAEWVFDWYDKTYYSKSPYSNPTGPISGKYRVIRGGAWNSFPSYLRSKARYGYHDGKGFYGIGCRCAKTIISSKK